MNQILFGDAERMENWPPWSVFGVFRDGLTRTGISTALIPPVAELAKNAAANAYAGPWPYLSVPDDNQPRMEPARLAAGFRPSLHELVSKDEGELDLPRCMLHSAVATVELLGATREVLDSAIGVRLAMEIVIGMAKACPLDARDQVVDEASFKGQVVVFEE